MATRLKPSPAAETNSSLDRLNDYQDRESADRRVLRRSILIAVGFHAGLLAITLPSFTAGPIEDPAKPKVYVVETVRYQPEKPKPEPKIPKERPYKVPYPDPTPHDPEPLSDPVPETFDDLPIDTIDFAVPLEAPEPPPAKPVFVTGEVVKPVPLASPQPSYTEIARKARITGTVILQSTIDAEGNVTDVEVLKGLPMGLTEAAADAVRRWKFKPATLKGKPIPVYFNLTVHFGLS